jgi:hypothetical protein
VVVAFHVHTNGSIYRSSMKIFYLYSISVVFMFRGIHRGLVGANEVR